MPLGAALVFGGILIDLWAGQGMASVLTDLGRALIRPELWLLILNITLILEFGYYMAWEPNSRAILAASGRLGGRHGRALGLVLMPAAIGLVPMPGGALFSAPLVGESLREKEMPAAWKVSVNYWFRHIFEFWWPLYPVVIVSLSIFSLHTWQFFVLQIPFTLVSLVAGWFFILRSHVTFLADDSPAKPGKDTGLRPVLLPLCIVVLCSLILPGAVGRLVVTASPTVGKLGAMLVGLLLGLLYIRMAIRDTRDFTLFAHLFSHKTGNVVLTLAGVMLFQTMLDASGLLPEAAADLHNSSVPVAFVIGFLPFLAGLVTGVAIGFAGPAFPLVVGLVGADPHLSEAAALVLAFAMGYAGMMLSPVHLCFLLTRRYFSSALFSTYVYLFPCCLAIAAWGVLMYVALMFAG